ncbi:Protein indeterminate-domain 1 [Vitis vinifera]|uniref:Protein indeterminate-domain 1 n=1 Tax=Vitis vinifera TaxID=29760 RepID=A0A438GP33_VITVI|nr:Protein indeterminate-domain 1 [Vitis vinifera]
MGRRSGNATSVRRNTQFNLIGKLTRRFVNKEYKCDCGTLFSRRDSFITHRAFCDALAEESAKTQTQTAVANPNSDEDPKIESPPPPPPPPPPLHQLLLPSTAVISAVLPIQSPEKPTKSLLFHSLSLILESSSFVGVAGESNSDLGRSTTSCHRLNASCSSSTSSSSNGTTSSSAFASLFVSSTASASLQQPQATGFSGLSRVMTRPDRPTELTPSSSTEPISLCLSTNHGSSIFGTAGQERRQYAPPPTACHVCHSPTTEGRSNGCGCNKCLSAAWFWNSFIYFFIRAARESAVEPPANGARKHVCGCRAGTWASLR